MVLCSHLSSMSILAILKIKRAFIGQARQSTASSARTGGSSRPSSHGGAGSTVTAQGVDDNDNIKARFELTSWISRIVANNKRAACQW